MEAGCGREMSEVLRGLRREDVGVNHPHEYPRGVSQSSVSHTSPCSLRAKVWLLAMKDDTESCRASLEGPLLFVASEVVGRW